MKIRAKIMAKKKRIKDIEPKPQGGQDVQNEKPIYWESFESFWHECVKNGTPSMMHACKEHIKALGWMDDQEKWIDGTIHFGIPVEK